MAIVILLALILLALILFTFCLAAMLLSNHTPSWMPGPTPDNIIHIEDWMAALEQRRLRTTPFQPECFETVTLLPVG